MVDCPVTHVEGNNMTKPAEIIAAIYDYLPVNEHTRDVIMSGQPVTADLLMETLDRSANDGLNLALHCADEAVIEQVFSKFDEHKALFLHSGSKKYTAEEEKEFVRSALAFEFSEPVLSAMKLLTKIELDLPVVDHVEIKHDLLVELAEISKGQAAERELYLSTRADDIDNPIFDAIHEAISPFYPVIPMIKQLVSTYVLDNIKEASDSSLDLWQQSDYSGLAKFGQTKKGLQHNFAISEHVITHSDDFQNPSKALGIAGRKLKSFSPEQRIALVSESISSVKGFSSEDLSSSGAVFYFSMLKVALESPGLKSKAFELADEFRQRFFTQPAAEAHFRGLFDGEEYGVQSADGMVAAVATKEKFERDPAVAYEVMSRINQLHPNFDAKDDPSKLLTLPIHKDFVSTALAFYLAQDPKNEQIVRAAITNTWQQEVFESVTAEAPAIKKRREQESDSDYSM
jgi:hypothetical protein